MKKLVLSAVLVCAVFLLGVPASHASELDFYLQPHCGVEPLPKSPPQIVAEYGDEIFARASGFLLFQPTAENEILLWYLGGMKTPEARQLATRVVREGLPEFKRMVMGAVSFSPDWTGLRLVGIGASDADEMTRDSASSILADTDYSVLATSGPTVAAAQAEILAALKAQIAVESNPRLRGNFQTALQKIQAVALGS